MGFLRFRLERPQASQTLYVYDIFVYFSKFIYPKRETQEDKGDSSEDETTPRARPLDGKYELFTQLDNTIADEICNLVLNGERSQQVR